MQKPISNPVKDGRRKMGDESWEMGDGSWENIDGGWQIKEHCN